MDDSSSSFSQDKLGNDQHMQDALHELSRQTSMIRRTGMCFLAATLLNVMVSIYIIIIISSFATTKVFGTRDDIILLVPLFLFALVACLVALYDQMLQRGRGIFEEISDELEWHVKNFSREYSNLTSKNAPPLYVRIVLREFVRSCYLPLFHEWRIFSRASIILILNLFLDMCVIYVIVTNAGIR